VIVQQSRQQFGHSSDHGLQRVERARAQIGAVRPQERDQQVG
jgi:hypothetical protein